MAEYDKSIQGYEDGVFFERNSGLVRNKAKDNTKLVYAEKLF